MRVRLLPDPGARRWVVLGLLALVASCAVAGALWRKARDPDRRLGPPPTVAGDECGVGRPPGALFALDGSTGSLRWSRELGAADGRGPGPPTGVVVADGTVAVTVDGAGIAAFAARDGSHLWCGEGDVISSVADRLFTVRAGATVELDPGTGRGEPVEGEVLSGLLEDAAGPVAVESAYAGYPLQALDLRAKDRRSGRELWARRVPGFQLVTTHRSVIVNDQTDGTGHMDFSAPQLDVRLTAYDLRSGEQEWSVPSPYLGTMVLAGDLLVTGSDREDEIVVRDAHTGRRLWARRHGNPGRTGRFSEWPHVAAASLDPATGDIYVVVWSEPPYRD